MPDLAGLRARQARLAAQEAGVVVVGDQPDGPPLTAGVVTGQDPEPGRSVARGSAVRVTVRRSALVVPAFGGLTIPEARQAAADCGLVVLVEPTEPDWPAEAGVVLRQHPPPGVPADPGSWVSVWSGPPAGGGPAGVREPAGRPG